jgi:hypothetical protein
MKVSNIDIPEIIKTNLIKHEHTILIGATAKAWTPENNKRFLLLPGFVEIQNTQICSYVVTHGPTKRRDFFELPKGFIWDNPEIILLDYNQGFRINNSTAGSNLHISFSYFEID